MNTNDQYLNDRVTTASQPQLHLMLIDGAIRFAREADARFEANDVDGASHPLRQAMDIASELAASVKHSSSEINTKLAALYDFIFTRLTMAFVNTDREKLLESIRVLMAQRETWQLACEKAAQAAGPPPATVKAPHQPISLPTADPLAGGGLSFEA